jgi:membrane protease YdiL (CAAX protease family)
MTGDMILKALFATCLIISGYLTYYFLSTSEKISNWIFRRYPYNTAEIYRFLFQKITGFLMLGVLPGIFFYSFFELSTTGYSVVQYVGNAGWLLLGALAGLILITTFFSSKAKEVHSVVPKMRLQNWRIDHLLLSMAGWGLYLLSYEFIFRQLLLFSWAEAYGSYTAILVNVVLYALFHLPKGKLETLGSIPFGIILCLVSLQSGSFLPAFLLHFTLAASTEIFSIYHNPGMYFNFKLIRNE